MQEYFFLRSVYNVFGVPDGVVEFFSNLVIGQTINKPALEHPPVTLAVDVFVNHCDDLAVGVFLRLTPLSAKIVLFHFYREAFQPSVLSVYTVFSQLYTPLICHFGFFL